MATEVWMFFSHYQNITLTFYGVIGHYCKEEGGGESRTKIVWAQTCNPAAVLQVYRHVKVNAVEVIFYLIFGIHYFFVLFLVSIT